jgi:hypothetical protein
MPPKPAAKKEQPKDSVGTRKGYERYVWELKDNNKEFWMLGHAPVKIVSLVSWTGIPAWEGRGS